MKNKYLLFIFVLFLIIQPVKAGLFNSGDITFSLNQKEYYFKVGENAIIPLEIENTYGKQINGILSYTYTQEINQGGMHMSSSNTQSTTFSTKEGKSTENLDFGTSNNPSTISVSLKFSYTEKEARVVNLEAIKVHFVSEESQKQNPQDKQSVSSEKDSTSQQSQNVQDPLQQMQKEINEMIGGNQQQNQQTTEQKMQNNQLEQDSSALKNQMQKQLQEQENMKQEFQKSLSKNKEFQKEHQDLLQKGYNLTSGSLNPDSENSGKFDLQYQKQDGDTAELKGEMENGEIKNMQKLTSEDKNRLMDELKENKDFQQLNKKLQENGFEQKNLEFSLEENQTKIFVNYENFQNQTQKITAEVINGTIYNVSTNKLDEESYFKKYFWLWFFVVVSLLIGYFVYRKYFKKVRKDTKESPKISVEKPFDYKTEARKLLNESKILFKKEKYKDAYEKAGQALRLYLSYENGLKKEVTNDEIIKYLKENNKESKHIKECFDRCSLVEFAKYEANKKDFDKVLEIVRTTIDKF